MNTITHGLRRRSFLLLPFALLLAIIAFTAMSAGAASSEDSADDDEIDITAFDRP